MIKLCRLDDRLIHGQIATKWSRVLGVDRIVVADDYAASNPIVAKSLLLATPAQFKAAIRSVDEVIKLMAHPKSKEHDVLLICGNPDALLKLVENVEGITRINIGNWGILEANDGKERKRVSQFVMASDDEIETFKKIAEKVDDFVFQVTPEAEAKKVSSIFH